jgi:serine protease Do
MSRALVALVGFANVYAAVPTLAPRVPQMTAPVVNVHSTRHLSASSVPLVGDLLPTRQVHSVGSGVIIASDGLVLTNEHIVHGATDVRVSLADGRELVGFVVGTDEKLDLAVLRVDAHRRLPAARLGRSGQLRVGDFVVAVGNPYGLDHSVTSGIVSANARVLDTGPPAPLIQTDASINPGNSGGPLYTLDGKVIALNVAIVAGAHGIGFAIPIDVVRRALPQLERDGHIRRGSVGITVMAVPDDVAHALRLKRVTGALVTGVEPDGPAARGGLLPGDVILRWDGERVASDADLPWLVALTPPDTHVTVGILREGDPLDVRLTVGAPDPSDEHRASP